MLFTALLGNPVEHSVSNRLFSELAHVAGIEYAHIKMRVSTTAELPDYLFALQRLGCAGVNVTLPYKLDVTQYLHEQDAGALAIGAVNTVAFRSGGRRVGYNTDGMAAYRAIVESLRPVLAGDRVVVLGAGGAARAIIHELYQRTDRIHVHSRGWGRLEQLASDFRFTDRRPLELRLLEINMLIEDLESADFIVNATPVGMYPQRASTLLSERAISHLSQVRDLKTLYAFDAVFNPHLTQMLEQLQAKGSPVCSGLRMMVYQAMAAFEIWTGRSVKDANVALIEKSLVDILSSHYGEASSVTAGRIR